MVRLREDVRPTRIEIVTAEVLPGSNRATEKTLIGTFDVGASNGTERMAFDDPDWKVATQPAAFELALRLTRARVQWWNQHQQA